MTLHDLTAVDAAWYSAINAEALLEAVETRLVDAGAVIELRQFRGMSAQEIAILVERERSTPGHPQTGYGIVAA